MTRHEAVEILEEVKMIDDSMFAYSQAYNDALDMAIEALKAQEARVMTLEEVLATEVVYAEDIDKAEIIPVLVNRRAHDRIVLVRAHLMGSPSHMIYPLISEYGKRWRCWTSRPDEKRREETPWN